MKGTELFAKTIQEYLDKRAEADAEFAQRRAEVNRPMEEIVQYILNEVHKSGCNGFSDEEIWSLAMTAAEEANLDIGKPLNCSIHINRHVELTEEEKAEMRAKALQRYQDEELAKMRQRNERKAQKQAETNKQPELSLFDL